MRDPWAGVTREAVSGSLVDNSVKTTKKYYLLIPYCV